MSYASNELRSFASNLLGDAALEASVGELRSGIALKERHTRTRLLARLAEVVGLASELTAERDRILVARLLVSLLPDSLELLQHILRSGHQGETLAELQFSTFVALSDGLGSEITPAIHLSLLDLIQTFLLQIASDDAQAAWMAGDLLGDHWPIEASLPILFHAAKHAHHAAGREGALHGLSHALLRVTKQQQWEIIGLVRQLAQTDRSASVRSYAASIAGSLRGL